MRKSRKIRGGGNVKSFSALMSALVCFALAFFIFLGGGWAQTTIDCANQPTGTSDRDILIRFYCATGGPTSWTNKANWGTIDATTTLNDWHGVTASSGVVSALRLNENQLSGTIPKELGNLSSLTRLHLSRNKLSGTIPKELGKLTGLINLWLGQNQLSGTIPTELGNMAGLIRLYLWGNQLSGEIPTELGKLTMIQELDLSENQLSGPIPTELAALTSMVSLHLDINQLSGTIPTELAALTSMTSLRLHDNQLSGTIPTELGSNLWYLFLHNNRLSGTIPTELGDLTNLRELLLHNNRLSGTIPTELGDLTNLFWLYLNQNQLSGTIPTELGELTRLERLRLDRNQLSGPIPTELGNLTNLFWLILNNNQLSETIPTELGRMASLQYLYLHNNRLSGPIPTELGSLISLVELSLSYNRPLSGTLPAGLRNITYLESLDIRCTSVSVPEDMAFQTWVNGINFRRGCPPPPPPPPPPFPVSDPEEVQVGEEEESGFPLTPVAEGDIDITYGGRPINISVTRDPGVSSDDNPAVIIPRGVLDRVRGITFELSEDSPENPPSGFRLGGLVADIDLVGVTLRAGETVTVCLPPAGDGEGSHIHHYDEVSEQWERLESSQKTVNDVQLVCAETDAFSRFGVFIPVIDNEETEGVLHDKETEDGFPLTPRGAGGSIVYGDRTIYLSVTGDVGPSSGDPAVIVPRSILDRVERITFELSEVSPQSPPSGLHLAGFTARIGIDLLEGSELGEEETVAVCLPSAGGSDLYRYNDEGGEWELVESRLEMEVNGDKVVCADAGAVSLTGVFVEERGGCAVAAAGGEGTVRWQRAVFNLLLTMSVLLLIPGRNLSRL